MKCKLSLAFNTASFFKMLGSGLFKLFLSRQMEVDQLLSLSGPALAQAISSLLETPGLYVFSDILELPNVREVRNIFQSALITLYEFCV